MGDYRELGGISRRSCLQPLQSWRLVGTWGRLRQKKCSEQESITAHAIGQVTWMNMDLSRHFIKHFIFHLIFQTWNSSCTYNFALFLKENTVFVPWFTKEILTFPKPFSSGWLISDANLSPLLVSTTNPTPSVIVIKVSGKCQIWTDAAYEREGAQVQLHKTKSVMFTRPYFSILAWAAQIEYSHLLIQKFVKYLWIKHSCSWKDIGMFLNFFCNIINFLYMVSLR